MIVTDQNQADLGEFERESQKLLLDIAMEASNQEMRNMVAIQHNPANLSGYYRSLQTWRAPVLHQVDAQNKPSSLHDGEFDQPDRTFDRTDRTFDQPDRTFDRTDRTLVRTDRTFVRTDRTVCTPLVT
jgi:hypothetical protein